MKRSQIEDYLKNLENQLVNDSVAINIELISTWANSFPKKASVFLFREDGVICYVAETASIKDELNGILKSKNHAFRINLGKQYFAENPNYTKSSISKEFSDEMQTLINERIIATLTISYILVDLGRRELEERLINKFSPKYVISINTTNANYLYYRYNEYRNAYLPWTTEDDNKLKLFYNQGKTIKELTEIFGRNKGAIYSRIKKLVL